MNTDGTEEDIDKPTAPPPKDSELSGEINGQRLATDTQQSQAVQSSWLVL